MIMIQQAACLIVPVGRIVAETAATGQTFDVPRPIQERGPQEEKYTGFGGSHHGEYTATHLGDAPPGGTARRNVTGTPATALSSSAPAVRARPEAPGSGSPARSGDVESRLSRQLHACTGADRRDQGFFQNAMPKATTIKTTTFTQRQPESEGAPRWHARRRLRRPGTCHQRLHQDQGQGPDHRRDRLGRRRPRRQLEDRQRQLPGRPRRADPLRLRRSATPRTSRSARGSTARG